MKTCISRDNHKGLSLRAGRFKERLVMSDALNAYLDQHANEAQNLLERLVPRLFFVRSIIAP
jgi:hypothetical protein